MFLLLKKYYSLLIVTIVCAVVFSNLSLYKKNNLFCYDTAGYQLYLPAVFIYHDVKNYDWYDSITAHYTITHGEPFRFGINTNTGYNVNTYPIGNALLTSPFFLFADVWSRCSQQYPRDGFSWGYQLWASVASIFFVLLGLWLLHRALQFYFSNGIVNASILITFFGTNVYAYSLFNPCMSHPVSFFLFAWVFSQLLLLARTHKVKHALLLGLALGLAFITRNTALLVLIFPGVVYGIHIFDKKLRSIVAKNVMAMAAGFAIGVLPQVIYIYEVSGHWWLNTYAGYAFNFAHPQFINGLFSFRKGLFVYTPLAALPIVGIFYLTKNKLHRHYAVALSLFLMLYCYVIFAWHIWYLGWGFGCRAFVEVFAILIFPLAMVLQKIASANKILMASAVGVVLLLVALNLFQTWQYSHNILHGERCNRKYYWRVFLRSNATETDRQLINMQMKNEDGGW